jgi:hypothetical protein
LILTVHEGWEPANLNRPSFWFFVPAIRKSSEKHEGPNNLLGVGSVAVLLTLRPFQCFQLRRFIAEWLTQFSLSLPVVLSSRRRLL